MYLDANFFIIARFSQNKQGESAREIFTQIVKGKSAITSALVLDEVMWVLIKNKQGHKVREVIEDIYATRNLMVK